MRKTLFLLSFFTSLAVYLHGQNVRIYDTRNQLLEQNYEYVVLGTLGQDFIQAHFKVKNEGSQPIDVKVRKQELALHGDSEFTFCWMTCYASSVTESVLSMTIPAGSFGESTLDADFLPDVNVGGITRVALTAFDMANPSDSARVVVKFDFLASVESQQAATVKLYPNPTEGDLTVSGGQGKKLSVYNTIGQLVHTQNLLSNEESVDISSLKSGIYMVQLSDNGKITITRKLVKR
jgi:hypothetical protein